MEFFLRTFLFCGVAIFGLQDLINAIHKELYFTLHIFWDFRKKLVHSKVTDFQKNESLNFTNSFNYERNQLAQIVSVVILLYRICHGE